MSAIASSSRTVLRSAALPSGSPKIMSRSVIHHARPPRVPALHSPQSPKQPLPTSGTSHPNPAAGRSSPPFSRVEGSSLTLHHAPPPTAPSYTNGVVPPFLRWVGGESVRLTGEEQAPKRIERRGKGFAPAWDDQVKMKMKDMRARGMSRMEIAKSLSISPEHIQNISRAAPLTTAQRSDISAKEEEARATWGYNKTVARAIRQKRRTLW